MWNDQGYDGGFADSGRGGGGGGYMQSQGGFGTPGSTQNSERTRRPRVQHLIPCTGAQLMAAQQNDDMFCLGDIDLNQVTMVGLVRQAEKSPTNILYKVDDMTCDPLDVRQWVDADEETTENNVVPPGTYVRVVGHLRSFQNKKSLVAFKILPLEDMNELTCHILEVVHSHMALGKPPVPAAASIAVTTSMPLNTSLKQSAAGTLRADNGLAQHQTKVLTVIRSCHSSEGMSMQELKSRIPAMNPGLLKQTIDFLSNEGHIYSTIDDDHFRSTEVD
ncbi:replication protein A 32 kDa subunit [Lampetra fluviatilis]